MKKIVLTTALFALFSASYAQTKDELKKELN